MPLLLTVVNKNRRDTKLSRDVVYAVTDPGIGSWTVMKHAFPVTA